MSIKHHISDELLASYAAGNLSEGWSIAVASHLSLCPDCRTRLHEIECVGGALLEELPESDIEQSSWNSILLRLDDDVQVKPTPKNHYSDKTPIFPQPLRDYIGGDVESVRWRNLGRGAYQLVIPTGDKSTTVRLLKIPAGKPVPEHGHGGRELTLVLSGSFADGDDVFARGDIEEADSDLIHQPVATPDADCICLAVTDAPLKFQSWVVRLVQTILGI